MNLLKNLVRPILRPPLHWVRRKLYAYRFNRAYAEASAAFGSRILLRRGIHFEGSADEIWKRVGELVPPGISLQVISLAGGRVAQGARRYWERYQEFYAGVGAGREKALEHSLTFELMDFSKVRRYCDVASATSPIAHAFKIGFSKVEFWRQDLLFQTDPVRKVIGGFAQEMKGVEDGFFDAMALHCSFEHFTGSSDGELMREIDRVLSAQGACLILPLYLDQEHRVYFDPTCIGVESLRSFDAEAKLCATFDYRQEHGRHYQPETLVERVLKKIPPGLQATLIRFTDQASQGELIYLSFALLLHRENSIVTAAVADS